MPRGDLCLAYLAGTCRFTATTCKKRHPAKPEADKLRAKYSKTKCRFGDECKTTNCLYTHPRDGAAKSQPEVLLEQAAFPPLAGDSTNANGSSKSSPGLLPGSAWKAAPTVTPPTELGPPLSPPAKQQQQEQQQQQQQQPPKPAVVSDHSSHINAQAPAWFPGNPQEEVQQGMMTHSQNGSGAATTTSSMNRSLSKNLNVNAKVWVPAGTL